MVSKNLSVCLSVCLLPFATQISPLLNFYIKSFISLQAEHPMLNYLRFYPVHAPSSFQHILRRFVFIQCSAMYTDIDNFLGHGFFWLLFLFLLYALFITKPKLWDIVFELVVETKVAWIKYEKIIWNWCQGLQNIKYNSAFGEKTM